ncbi:LOW QUALITY PROTEIN: olfactory receptor 5AS1-like [Bufo gargarizans]|uniref:LOW QUALITY PROTEIN: olfactory receptor 5AS1-like n=1 Tax=Bufo gargarizans TaxID=30331 RepID=UPI001CF5EDE0|nr:LOW QUALITY PROTEIN: olfactory receptor 5AS1-like [Bufo gargarizans]
MDPTNITSPDMFVLLGLSDVPYLQVICFLMFLVMYMITLAGNLLLIIVVKINPALQTPMYFFLSNLSFIDIFFSSTIVPQILINTLAEDKSISLFGCALQMYFSLALGAMECIILAVMAYDRFAAICRPLHYNTIMNMRLCITLAVGSWTACFINSAFHVFITVQLPYCKSHHISHFFCEIPPFLQISCRDTRLNEIAMYVSAGIVVTMSLFLTLISYIHIIATIFKIQSSQGRQKAFSTCASHLIVVTLYYGTIMFMYLRPRSAYLPETDKTISVLYTVVTPMLNPFIYSVRNKDVKCTIKISLTRK